MKLLTWNILAPKNATPEAFPTVDAQWLAWEHRFPLIQARILAEDPDIIFLQEVEEDDLSLQDWKLRDFLDDNDYCVWSRHPPDSRTGILTAVRSALLIGAPDHLTSQLVIPNSVRVERMNARLAGANYGHYNPMRVQADIVALRTTNGHAFLHLLNVHLKAGLDHEATRLEQVEALRNSYFGDNEKMIVAGDFNTEPGSASYNELLKGICGPLSSSYGTEQAAGHFTSCKTRAGETQIRCIDHIFHRGVTQLSLTGLGELTADLGGFPTKNNPSDHLPLILEFEL